MNASRRMVNGVTAERWV